MSDPRTAFIEALQAQASQPKTASGEGQEFFDLMSEKWRNVHYDPKHRRGWVQAGSLGRIEFEESGNDSAVIVTTSPMRFKADSERMVEILEHLNKTFGM